MVEQELPINAPTFESGNNTEDDWTALLEGIEEITIGDLQRLQNNDRFIVVEIMNFNDSEPLQAQTVQSHSPVGQA